METRRLCVRGRGTVRPSRMTTPADSPIRWPERYLPARTAVFVHNEIVIPAPAEDVWGVVGAGRALAEVVFKRDRHAFSFAYRSRSARPVAVSAGKTFGMRITSKGGWSSSRARGLPGMHTVSAWRVTTHGC